MYTHVVPTIALSVIQYQMFWKFHYPLEFYYGTCSALGPHKEPSHIYLRYEPTSTHVHYCSSPHRFYLSNGTSGLLAARH